MSFQNKILNLLTVCRKSGKLIIGFDPVKEKLLEHKVECVLVSKDVSAKTLKEVHFFCSKENVNIINLETSTEEFEQVFKRKVAVMAVLDKGFAKRFEELSDGDKENAQPNLQ
jgi:ribosomal protein L7Ae-like RNA K-turn-binding protein